MGVLTRKGDKFEGRAYGARRSVGAVGVLDGVREVRVSVDAYGAYVEWGRGLGGRRIEMPVDWLPEFGDAVEAAAAHAAAIGVTVGPLRRQLGEVRCAARQN